MSENGRVSSGSSHLAELVDGLAARLQAGEAVDVEGVARAHPEHAAELRRLLPALGALDELSRSGEPASGLGPAPEGAPASGVLGDFRVIREVGRGGMGVVYEAEQISLCRRVALKVLPFAATMDPRQLQRFQNEARAAAGLHHEHIVPVYGVGSDRGVHYYAMQFVDGCTLAEVIARQRRPAPATEPATAAPAGAPADDAHTTAYTPAPAPEAPTATVAAAPTEPGPRDAAYFRRVAGWGVQAAEALDHAHALGVVHRDVKPGNLMLDAAGKLWVTDFGLARVGADSGLTVSGDLLGTLRYMSPEQALGRRVVVDHRTDVYSLGVTLYELLTLQPAFAGEDRAEVLRRIASEEPRPPRKLDRAIPAELETVVLKAMEKAPEGRYATAQELADDLKRFLNDEPIRARRPTPVQRGRKWARRHRGLVGGAAAALLVGLAVLVGSVGWVVRDRAARRDEDERRAREALGEADRFLRDDKWPEAGSALKQAQAALAHLGAGPDLHRQAEELRRDLEMVRKLEEARLRRAAEKDGYFDWGGSDEAYAEAFGWYGLDPGELGPREVAGRVRARPIARQVVAALTDWAIARQNAGARGWQRLLLAARAADPDGLRGRVRDALDRKDRKALEGLVASARVEKLPPATLLLLVESLRQAGAAERAMALLREAQQAHPADFWINHDLAWALYQSRPARLGEAIRYYVAAVALRPDSPGARLRLGKALGEKGDMDEAIACFRQAVRLKKDLAEAHSDLGLALKKKGRLEEAIAEHKQAIRLKKDSPRAHFNLGCALQAKGRLDEAIAEYRAALGLNKDFPEADLAHNNLGGVLHLKGRLNQAVAEFREALRLKRDNPEAHYNLGNTLWKKGRLDQAVAEFREALRLKEDFPDARLSLGCALADKGLLDEAIAEWREALRLRKDYPEAHKNLGTALHAKGRLDEAIAEYREVISLKKDDPQAHNNLGTALQAKGLLAEAITEYREAIRLKKDYAEPHRNLGTALSAKGRLGQAIAAYREAISLKKDDPQAHYNLGLVLAKKGRTDAAITEFREALALKKDYPEAHYNLGVALYHKGRLDEAIAEYREVLRLKKDDPEAHCGLGVALCDGKRDYDGAIAEFREAVALKKDDPVAYYNLGNALRAKRLLNEAVAAYRSAIHLNKNDAESHCGLGNALKDKGRLAEAVAEFRLAIRINKDYPEAHYSLGNALRDKGLLDEAVAAFRRAIRLKADFPEPRCNLGLVLVRQGQFWQAAEELRRGHDLGSRRPGWPYPSAQWVRQAEQLAALDERLSAILAGKAKPKDASERLAFAQLCQQFRRRYAAAARFYAEVFADQPALAEAPQAGHRYNAARAAALAGCGKGKDAPADTKERARLRRQALDWLRADLAARRTQLKTWWPRTAAEARGALRHWQADADLAGVRGAEPLKRLPEAERGGWERLWREVDELRRKAEAPAARR